jgi:EAL domain-containing protein (putative c-di-GMP-specific phosphodiesterase class I)
MAQDVMPYVQPIVALMTGTVSGYEALTRFRDSAEAVHDVFAAAWRGGSGPELEAAALRAALDLPGRPPTAYLGLNVSPRAVDAGPVLRVLDQDLTGIVIELTEGHYVGGERIKWLAAWFRERGARIAIDDVGTGYAGLERIIQLSPELIKLDRSLVAQLRRDAVSRAMVESLVRFAARSGASVCAEGIETYDELEVVAELDISFGQGYLFGPADETWTSPPPEAITAAVSVQREALNATPKQSLFLDDYVLLERLADRFSEAEELEDLHHAVAGLARLVGSDDVVVSVVDASDDIVVPISHDDWSPVEGGYTLDRSPRTRWVLDTRRAAQVLATDRDADAHELARMARGGFSAMLLVPATTAGQTVALLEFFRWAPKPWTITEIRLARIGAGQLAATLDRPAARRPLTSSRQAESLRQSDPALQPSPGSAGEVAAGGYRRAGRPRERSRAAGSARGGVLSIVHAPTWRTPERRPALSRRARTRRVDRAQPTGVSRTQFDEYPRCCGRPTLVVCPFRTSSHMESLMNRSTLLRSALAAAATTWLLFAGTGTAVAAVLLPADAHRAWSCCRLLSCWRPGTASQRASTTPRAASRRSVGRATATGLSAACRWEPDNARAAAVHVLRQPAPGLALSPSA